MSQNDWKTTENDRFEKLANVSPVSCPGLLDRILPALKRTGHKVLLFSQMTELLNIIEDYLRWRAWNYFRIDGSVEHRAGKGCEGGQLQRLLSRPFPTRFG